ncbi:hypothetical protein [Thermaerobacillus caldiproteolyticus]|uniref:Uncharacterized protein n=1 Tax=Thermaerobacillus caldiproteolyticus TaxID=247480 RepID=A0A7W0BZL7_9BACL|nr:hypothetical protein [Anoxybacillus caldiproteolyticus]MBA2874586.1 hypothetical protein [Anoxybacillus caldiproteolyticus]
MSNETRLWDHTAEEIKFAALFVRDVPLYEKERLWIGSGKELTPKRI